MFGVWTNQSLLASLLCLPKIKSQAQFQNTSERMECSTSGPEHKPNRNVYLNFDVHELAGGQAGHSGSAQTYQAH